MASAVSAISVQGLVLTFVPAALVIGILWRWRAGAIGAVVASIRMLVQLFAIGYVLIFIFESDNLGVIAAVLVIMLCVGSWIAIRPLEKKDTRSWLNALIAITAGAIPILMLVTQAVIDVEPWFSPRYIVPLAGMIIAGSMNAVSLAAERYQAESSRGVVYEEARRIAMVAALIPIVNSLLAVGLVSLPGMMTGQILSGVSPLVAAKYQIVVMTMLFGATGLSAAFYLVLIKTLPQIGK